MTKRRPPDRQTILIADDSEIKRAIPADMLGKECEIIEAANGMRALETIRERNMEIDLMLLDIMLGKDSGFDLLEQERETPVICLTAKGSLGDKLRGLHLGADDYIVKPFETLELVARVQAVLRRTMKTGQGVFRVDDVAIDFDAKTVTRGGEPVELTPQEYALLEALAINRNLALSREKILDKAWNVNGFYGDIRTVDVHVSRLRQKLGLEKRIKTVYKVGYRLEVRDEGE